MTRKKTTRTKNKTGAGRLPGDRAVDAQVARMIRVNHAGEYGAARIYEGQLAVLGERDGTDADTIRAMRDAEQRHLDIFNQMVLDRQVRPTALQPLWHIAGFALGAASALAGPRATMACTVAVEEVIEEHYAHQAAQLGDNEAGLRDTIEAFRADEIEHRDIGLAHGAEAAPAYRPLTAAVKAGSRLAIWLSTRV